jgi:hypothetical protein
MDKPKVNANFHFEFQARVRVNWLLSVSLAPNPK